ncbi:hypothetical protein BJY04DRAFT_229918 [Aspergillus karnatakaensis]|uniref:uncharacterized protein n=1 Tax=Aspergillus karnatakaensis TaxID=1810916 RepID=UPI003CCD5217
MSPQKTIAIIGATGNQGSSVATSFLSLPNWTVRAITRNPSSASAQRLASLGCELAQADLSDIPSLQRAFTGAAAIFVNTDFWARYISGATRDGNAAFEQEITHGKNAALAAAGIEGLERYVYSALPSLEKGSGGKYTKGLHLESKGRVVEFIETDSRLVELRAKSSFIYLGAYATNPLFTPRFDAASGVYKFIVQVRGSAKMPIIDAAASTGDFVRELVLTEAAGTKLLAYDRDSYLSLDQVVEIWERRTGEKAELETVSNEFIHRVFGLPLEALEAPLFIEEFGYMGGVEGFIEPGDLKNAVQTKSFEEWLGERDWKELAVRGEEQREEIRGVEL